MNQRQDIGEHSKTQALLCHLAMALDESVINGTLYGVLPQCAPAGLVQKLADNFQKQLSALKTLLGHEQALQGSPIDASLGELDDTYAKARFCLVRLLSFRSLALEELQALGRDLVHLRTLYVDRIRELETKLGVTKSFYDNRPAESTRNIDSFLATLPRLLESEWTKARNESQLVTRE